MMRMTIIDIVVKGRGLGKKLGYPTANLAQSHGIAVGVWRARVDTREAILIVGAFMRADAMPAEEVYILDFAGDLYGTEITVEVFEKIRDIETFQNNQELKEQIEKDIAYVHGHHQS